MPSTARRLGLITPFVLTFLLLLPGPLACQDVEADAEDAAPRQEMSVDDGSEAEGPLFSEKAREVIDEVGPDEAMGELSMLLGTSSDDYVMDVDGLIDLANEYEAEGQPDAAINVLQIASFADGESADAMAATGDLYASRGNATMAAAYYQQALDIDPEHSGARAGMEATGGALPEVPETPERQAAAEPDAEPEEEEEEEMGREERAYYAMLEGPARDDLDRFKGRYESEKNRSYWIMETCVDSGYLMAVPYADVQSWVLRSVSDLEFVQSNNSSSEEPAEFTFEGEPGGQATGLAIRMFLPPAPGQEGDRESVLELDRVGPLEDFSEPEGQDCITQFM
ncbi:MAG: tetratricopeptide repeat protein [Gemmatimonadota bacterium]